MIVDNIFVTICIPSYNRPSTLFRLLKSIDCSNKKIEILICEDNSPKRNEIKKIVSDYESQVNYNIRYHENEINLGFDGNIRNLVNLAKGKFLIFMGDDDIFIPKELDVYIKFLEDHSDIKYFLRSYISKHENGQVETFKYLKETIKLKSGEETVAWLFKRSVTICGFTISRDDALKCSTNKLDGTLLYQIYLMAIVCMENDSYYYSRPFVEAVQSFRDDKPMFGSSEAEKDKYTPGSVSHDNSINFTKSYFELTEYLDSIKNTNLTQKVRKDLSKYSYPFLSIQRKRGLFSFLQYAKRLEKEVGFGCTLYFYLYKWMLAFLGEKFCDKLIIFIKKRIGHTPNF